MTDEDVTQLSAVLHQASERLGLLLSATQAQQLIDYAVLFHRWNQTYNLSAVRHIDGIIKRHVIDALSVVSSIQALKPQRLADIGSGGGVPGIVLAIVCPELSVYLVESIGKKCRFLRYACQTLGLHERVTVLTQRVESWQVDKPIDVIICRAFTSLSNFTTITEHLGDQASYWLAMKSAYIDDEIEQLQDPFHVVANHVLDVPFESAQRHLLVIQRG